MNEGALTPREVGTWWMMGEGQVGTLAQQLRYGRCMLTPMFRAGLDRLGSSSHDTPDKSIGFRSTFTVNFETNEVEDMWYSATGGSA